MKSNRSLAISTCIHEFKTAEVLGVLEKEIPDIEAFESKDPTSRNRIFTARNTLSTMVLTSFQEDKTLKNSVDLFYFIHQSHKKRVKEELETKLEEQKLIDEQVTEKKAGRPKKYTVNLPKSLEKDISLNTAAYSKARDRLDLKITEELFRACVMKDVENSYSHFHGKRVFVGDGTYIQMQDTKSIREQFEVKHNGEGSDGYPQGLIVAVIERGTGQIHDFKLSNRHTSELALFYEMIDNLPPNSLILIDDLYNCFEIISKCNRKGIEFVMPAKRDRNYDLIEEIAPGDEIIRISTPKNRSKWLEENEKPNTFLIRKIDCKSPDGTEYVMFTSVLDKKITKDEIQLLYLTRWDIEICIREVKTIMDINILRSKTPEMALKELTVSLTTYNLIRKIILASIKDLPFSPKEDFIYRFYTLNKIILVDKKGRIYNKWSPGRRRTAQNDKEENTPKAKTK